MYLLQPYKSAACSRKKTKKKFKLSNLFKQEEKTKRQNTTISQHEVHSIPGRRSRSPAKKHIGVEIPTPVWSWIDVVHLGTSIVDFMGVVMILRVVMSMEPFGGIGKHAHMSMGAMNSVTIVACYIFRIT